MENKIDEPSNRMSNVRNVVLGLLIGGLAGAATMLLFAPQSGKQTRDEIQLRSIQFRDWTTGVGKKALAQARVETQEIAAGVREKAGEIKQRGQDKLVRQLDRVSAAIDAGKAAVEAA